MIRTRDFFISIGAFIVFIIVLLSLTLDKETPEQMGVLEDMVIMTEPQDTYSVEHEAPENSYMRRAIFIEKIRNALPDIVLPRNTVVETPEDIVEPSLLEPKITIPTTSTSTKPQLSTSTPAIDAAQSSSTSAFSSTTTKEQLMDN